MNWNNKRYSTQVVFRKVFSYRLCMKITSFACAKINIIDLVCIDRLQRINAIISFRLEEFSITVDGKRGYFDITATSSQNRIVEIGKRGKATWLYINEFHVLLNSEYSAKYLQQLWKKVRKQGGLCIGITRNVEDLLQNYTATTMLANSEFVVLLKQANTDSSKIRSVNHYDNSGHKVGESRPGLFGSVNTYDSNGNRTKHSDRGLFGGYNHYDD